VRDVYSPANSRADVRLPATVFIHGCRIPSNLRTTPKDWGIYISFGQLVAASGFVGVTFNHRFHPWDSLSDSQNDVMDLVAHIRSNAKLLGIDEDRIVLWAVREYSLLYHLSKNRKGTAPTFVARAGLDDATLNAGLDRFVQTALVNNITVDLMNHAQGQHGFDIEDDNDRSREIIKRTLEFIKSHS
jgi:hypothetical protein